MTDDDDVDASLTHPIHEAPDQTVGNLPDCWLLAVGVTNVTRDGIPSLTSLRLAASPGTFPPGQTIYRGNLTDDMQLGSLWS
ncbi:hypothetical protein CIB48_g10489 [Xylaria polymorpha]|nr:hypothetical protein CIB48_g10489 [Xylaria polymorpha]